MTNDDTLVSVGLPVRNAADRIERAVRSVLAQDHENLEVVISDNASTDGTEDICRELAAQDRRIVYLRNSTNVGLLNNFIGVARLAHGPFFRWMGDDDWLEPQCISRALDEFAADDRLILVTTQVAYSGPDGVHTARYAGTALRSDDPVTRFAEMLRLLNVSYTEIDPLYGMLRRDAIIDVKRRNMMHEDEVFAARLALAGPWGHVPEVLAGRNWRSEKRTDVARRLGVPAWRAHFVTTLQCRELLYWLNRSDLNVDQLRRSRVLVARMYTRRQQLHVAHRIHQLRHLPQVLVQRAGAQ